MFRPLLKYRKVLLLGDQAIFSGTSFLVTIMLARNLTVEEFGWYAGFVLVLYLFTSLISAFVVQPLQVSLPSAADKNGYLTFTFWFQTAISSLFIAMIPLVLWLPVGLPAGYAPLAGPAVLLSSGFVMQDYFRKRMLAEDRITRAFLLDSLLMVGHLAVMVRMMAAPTISLSTAMLLLGSGYLPPLLFGLYASKPLIGLTDTWKHDLRSHLNQGKWLFYSALVQWWAGNLFVVASGFFLGPAALGALRLVQSVFGVLNVLFQTFENYVLPQTASRMHESAEDGRRYLRQASGRPLIFVSLLLLVLFVFSDSIMLLAGGEQFKEYGFLVKGMSVLYALIFAAYPVRIAIRALMMNKVFFQGYVLTFLFGLMSSYLLLSVFHLAGAIAGLIISQLILLVYWQLMLNKKEFLLWK